MALDSETIWAALFERLEQRTASFTTLSRRRKAQWGIEQFPVLMLLDDSGDETPLTDRDAPEPVWSLNGEIIILTRPEEDGDAPTTTLNGLIKEVREALERVATDSAAGLASRGGTCQFYTNLGGLIRVLAITKVEKGASGLLAGQAMASITLELEAQ